MSLVIDSVAYPVFCAKDVSIETENEIILRTGVNSGLWRQKRARLSDWRASSTGVIITDNTAERYSPFYLLQEAIRRSENTYQFDFTNIDGDTVSLSGTGIIQLLGMSGSQSEFAQCSLNIEGTGPLIPEESPASGSETDENVDSDWWEMSENDTSVTGDSENGKNTTGKILLAVARETDVYAIITSGTPGNGEARHVSASGTTLFNPDMPATEGERVWQMWKDA